ncbi:hypothetical protein [Pasteuria penetrans]|uniref:hypothetical protein n=1 Tax=Pasteuria penetrans TaxID=86005 RepID=UPI000FBFFE0C|nr:hypothetical protein [Pasteuria penetrans]
MPPHCCMQAFLLRYTVHQRCYVHAIRITMNSAFKSLKKEIAKDVSYVLRLKMGNRHGNGGSSMQRSIGLEMG